MKKYTIEWQFLIESVVRFDIKALGFISYQTEKHFPSSINEVSKNALK